MTWSSTTPRIPSTVIPFDAADDGDVADLDVLVRDDDPAEDDRARVADELLAAVDEQRALVDAGREMHDRRLVRVPEPARRRERRGRRGDHERAAAQAELAAVLRVREPPRRQQRVAEHLREHPRGREETERDRERRAGSAARRRPP